MIPTNNTASILPATAIPFGLAPLFDFETGQTVFQDGRPVMADYGQAIEQWVRMLLGTERGKYPIYSDFGVSLYQFIGRRDLPVGVVDSEVKRQVSEQLLMHPEITGITGFSTKRTPKGAEISFMVQTKQGAAQRLEVRLNG
ncbi:DUF2634 domain-containing protein [Paenibacillus sp. TAB 01]|uniref:DUF2634 domain-containing protein n=1 Tax=Paenibacillus sp. TAB 01 TaxID=3368988 RepID=UPI0037523583